VQVQLCTIVGLTFDGQGVMYIPESFYNSVLRVAQDGTIRRIVGSNQKQRSGRREVPRCWQACKAATTFRPPVSP